MIERLKLVVPDGELRDDVSGFLSSAGLEFAGNNNQYLHSG